ncbi:MAG TPA: hypothetical protein VLN08_13020 [Vicinamibacterales bacterium]|nr:hypothetical protein [Vicinamibacterales bacterium]
MSRSLWPWLLVIAAVIAGRLLDRRFRLSNRSGTPWGEPEVTPGREVSGLVLLVVLFVGASLVAYACPFPRIE